MTQTYEHPLISHYQNTFDVTFRLWEHRNRSFLQLVIVGAIAALLTYNQEFTTAIIESAGINVGYSEKGVSRWIKHFPFELFHGILLLSVCYTMIHLFQRTATIVRNYWYLSLLEKEIRDDLKLPLGSIAFTREGDFYHRSKSRYLVLVKYAYFVIVGGLLTLFFYLRFANDFPNELPPIEIQATLSVWTAKHYFFVLDLLIAIPTALSFIGYVSVSNQRRDNFTPIKPENAVEGVDA